MTEDERKRVVAFLLEVLEDNPHPGLGVSIQEIGTPPDFKWAVSIKLIGQGFDVHAVALHQIAEALAVSVNTIDTAQGTVSRLRTLLRRMARIPEA